MASLLFTFCSKEGHLSDDQQGILRFTEGEWPYNANLRSANCIDISGNFLDSIGIWHNEFLESMFLPIHNMTGTNFKDSITSWALALNVSSYLSSTELEIMVGLGDSLYNRIFIGTDGTLDARDWANHPFTPGLYAYICTMFDYIDIVSSHDELVDSLAKLKDIVINDSGLTCHEKQTLRAGISVALHSSELWMPTDMGGMGWYDSYGQDIAGRRWSWKNALGGDLVAATGWCFEIVVYGAFGGPVATAAGAVAGTVACAMSSAFAGAGIP